MQPALESNPPMPNSTGVTPAAREPRWFWPLVLSAAFALRLGAVAFLVGLETPPKPGSDEQEYDIYAWNVAQGRGYRGPSVDVSDQDHLTAYRPPTTPLVYAGLYWLFGHRYTPLYIFNALLGAATIWLVYDIALRSFDRRAARWAAVLYAFYPLTIFYTLSINSEIHACFLVCLLVGFALRVQGPRGVV